MSQESVPLGNSITVLSGFPFPSAEFTAGEGKPLIRIRDLVSGKTETNFKSSFDTNYLIRRDDILIGMDGDFNVVRWSGPEALLNQRVCKITTNSSDIDGQFLYWWLKPHVEAIHRRTPQTTVRHLAVGDIYGIPKPLMQTDVQRFAAAVLDTMDEAISKTEAVIAKLKQVRAGLLHDLLTRGLDENGQLRDPVAHPEQFQDSPLGLIPKDWSICSMGELISFIRSGLSRAISFDDIGVPVVTSTNIVEDRFDPTELKYWYHEDPQGAKMADYYLDDGDVLLNFINSVAQIGKSCVFRGFGRPTIYTTNIFRLKPSKRITSEYLQRLLQSAHVQKWLRMITKPAVNQASFTIPELSRIPVAVPGQPEQKQVITFCQTYNIDLNTEGAYLTKLHELKSGLMNDLLTGRVRVPEGIAVTG